MFYVDKINYGGEPLKAMIETETGVEYYYTLIYPDPPVTHLMVAEALEIATAALRRIFQVDVTVDVNNLHTNTFIGEKLIFCDLVECLFRNSVEAQAHTFNVNVSEDSEHVSFSFSDDGDGIGPTIAKHILKIPITTKDNGLASSLFVGWYRARKIGAELTYTGKGIDGKGASFRLTCLKEMPNKQDLEKLTITPDGFGE